MARRRGAVPVDTNVIIAAHRTRSWRALTGGCRVKTVEDCVAETQTGFQRRRRELQIDAGELRDTLKAVHSVGNRERAALAVRIPVSRWKRGRLRFGLTRRAGTTHGSCAGRTGRVFDVAYGWGIGIDWCLWRNFSAMSATGREPLCERHIPCDGTRERLAN